jgi:hypothetical protein
MIMKLMNRLACILIVAFTACNGSGQQDDVPAGGTTAAGPRPDTAAGVPGGVPDSGRAGDNPSGPPAPRPSPAPQPPDPRTAPGIEVLQAIRVARHDGFDRVVFEFRDAVPPHQITYIDDPTSCGSGDRIRTAGAVNVQIRFTPAQGHDDAGVATVRKVAVPAGAKSLVEIVRSCDFEADLAWIVSLHGRSQLKSAVLSKPSRLVVDFLDHP